MIIFQRVMTFAGPADEVVPWAMEITDAVNKRTEMNASLWQGMFGGPIGTLAWSAMANNLTTLESANDLLGTDAAFLSLEAKARDWVTTPGQDYLLRVIHNAGGEYVRPGVGGYAEGTSAIPAEGKYAKAMAFGVEVSDVHSRLTHSQALFCSSAYGGFGELRWLSLYDSAAAVDNAAETIAKDDDFTALVDRAGDLFVEGLAQRTLARRIA